MLRCIKGCLAAPAIALCRCKTSVILTGRSGWCRLQPTSAPSPSLTRSFAHPVFVQRPLSRILYKKSVYELDAHEVSYFLDAAFCQPLHTICCHKTVQGTSSFSAGGEPFMPVVVWDKFSTFFVADFVSKKCLSTRNDKCEQVQTLARVHFMQCV